MKPFIKAGIALTVTLLVPAVALAASKKKAKQKTVLTNLKAFLLMIQFSENTIGNNAYRKLYGGSLFDDYSRHPNIPINRWGITSTAAGAYQFLHGTWLGLQATLRLPDFSPASQNRAAIELLRRADALTDILTGNIVTAIYKCKKIWASFPGAGYGQGERTLQSLLRFYLEAGGRLAKI